MQSFIMVDLASGWFEIKHYNNWCTITVANIVEHQWILRYPWPTQITYNRGNIFARHKFWHMVQHDYGIKPNPISVRNLQANTIVEHICQVIANIAQTFKLKKIYLNIENHWKKVLSAVTFAFRLTYHTTLKKTPGQLIFGWDMILPSKFAAN